MAQTFSGFNVPQKWDGSANYQAGQGGQLVRHALVTWRAIRPRNGTPPGTISGQWEQVPDTITSPNVAQAVQAALPPPKPIAPKAVVTGSRPVNVSSNNVSVSVFQGSGDSAFSGLVPAPPAIAGTALFLREDGMWAAAGGGGGTVTSVGLALPAEFTVSGSPVIASGTLTGAWASENNNVVFAGPAVVPGTPTFRALVFADLPAGVGTVTSVGVSTDASYLTVGATPVTTSGTITVNKTTGLTANRFVATPSGSTGTADLRAIVPADLAGTPGAGKYWDGAGSGAWTTLPAPGTGTVTSVAMSVPSFLSVAGSPVTTSGTFAVTLQTQSANNIFAGPTTGIAATPTFRSLVAADLPNTAVTPGSYTYSSITVDAQGRLTSASSGAAPTGTVTSVAMSVPSFLSVSGSPITTSGTLAVTLATETANTIFAGPTSGGAATPTFRSMVAADLPNTAVTPGSYTYSSITVDAQGRLTSASSGAAPTGTVTSVALSMPSILTVSGSPVTTSGTLTAVLANQNANLVFAGPASGAAAAPTFRAVATLDLGTGTANNTTYLRGDKTWQPLTPASTVNIPDLGWSPDIIPASPSVYDDEFNATSAATWLWRNQNGQAISIAANTGAIITTVATPTPNVTLRVQDITAVASGDYTFACKCCYLPSSDNGTLLTSQAAGLAMRIPGSGTIIVFFGFCTNGTTGGSGVIAQTTTGFTVAMTSIFAGTVVVSQREMYLRIRRVGTTLFFDQSAEGRTWFNCGSVVPAALNTYTDMGIFAAPFANNTSRANFSWFRKTA